MIDLPSPLAAALETPAAARVGAVLAIDLAALVANWRDLAARVGPAECGAVVKADAYGLGAVPVGRSLWQAGARTFFVADIEAGVRLRAALPQARIIVLHGVPAGTQGEIADQRLVPVLSTLAEMERWCDHAARLSRKLPAIIHVDTGMNRLGLPLGDLDRVRNDLPTLLAGLELQAWMSHLACADDPQHPLTAEQRSRFLGAVAGLPPAPLCLSNSAGIFHGANYHFDLVRPGIALYGPNPAPWMPNPMRPVIRLLGRILQVREVPAGVTVGYDATHRVTRPGKVAALGLGYADGYPWSLAGKGRAMIAGHPCPVIGRVSMDLLTVDVTEVPAPLLNVGGWAEVIGPARDVDQVAREAGTIGYEILTRLGARYHRVYHGG
ncbi:alanine racemase [Niveispirillum sp. SYP-B3756]|uniref:alanine racemase n=1 Tax=Niveispirillum sp. SYP-B3756 TaxID=2662178 RepID=UPI001291B3FA|nr:alanine racemase [Niveispirillum sp. SYP-B3756]MQP63779.1 alanine racemase [Niveispirillum sp. SYP-B3756]